MNDADRRTLTVNWMFPDLLWLNGDRGNVVALARLGAQLGLDVVINRVQDVSEPLPADLAVFGSGDLDTLATLAIDGEALRSFLSSQRRVIVFRASVALFARQTTRLAHPGFDGLGLPPATAAERVADNHEYGDDYLVEYAPGARHAGAAAVDIKTVAVTVDPEVAPFGTALFRLATRRRISTRFDGARHGSVVWTNLLGAAFVRNPLAGALTRRRGDGAGAGRARR